MRERGDTIVEVLFAVTVFSMIAVGGIALMNHGTAIAQRALETGLVREQMDAQVNGLRYLHNAYVASYTDTNADATQLWRDIVEANKIEATDGGAQSFSDMVSNGKCVLPPSQGHPFALDIRKLDQVTNGRNFLIPSVDDTATFAQVRYKDGSGADLSPPRAEGIWVQAVRSEGGDSVDYYDFHVRSCWLTPGQLRPVTLGTIVRLYDPAP